MKLYLAYLTTTTLMSGDYEHCLGVFDSEEKAWECLSRTSDFAYSTPYNVGGRVYHFDGELSYYWNVREVELNEPIGGSVLD